MDALAHTAHCRTSKDINGSVDCFRKGGATKGWRPRKRVPLSRDE